MDKIIEINNLVTAITSDAHQYPVVDGVSLSLNPGEIIGVVGESGCGKSMTALSLVQLLKKDFSVIGGEVKLEGRDLLKLSSKEMEQVRGKEISMIFQDVLMSLNPLMKIGHQIMEPLIIHSKMSKREAKKEAIKLLKNVGIPSPEKRFNEYPNSLSGGMRQRIMIAIAIACKPKVLIADEPTTALDVTVQAQILDLLKRLQKESKTAIILITHDLGVVYETCERAAVMYCGQIVAEGLVSQLFDRPLHPYTQGLVQSVPSATEKTERLYNIPGTVPAVGEYSNACRFADRCENCKDICRNSPPPMLTLGTGHKIRCHMYQEDSING